MVVRSRPLLSALAVAALLVGCQHASSQGRLFGGSGVRGPHQGRSVEARYEVGSARSETPVHELDAAPVFNVDTRLPRGRDIAQLTSADCVDLLDRSLVRFEQLRDDAAPSVATPVYVLAPLNGVSFGPKNGDAEHGMLDCRLAVALTAWAPILREAGIVKVEHYSTYRPGAKVRGHAKPSGHAHALAIDAARFHTADGRVLDVDVDWEDREHGGAPCPARDDESEAGSLLRRVVCEAVERDLFQVVLTPHYDRAHQNHVHLELVPDVEWSFVR
jgi:hypothetical protein